MTCQRCGASTTRSRLCRACALDDRYATGPVGGTSDDTLEGDGDRDEWQVDQQGLGDRDPEGQATLSGGIAKDGGER